MKLKGALPILVILIVSCSLVACRTSPPTKAADARNLVAGWKLSTVSGQSPAALNIKSWRIEFLTEGNWNYSGEMTGVFEGMKVKGSGTWLVREDQLEYTAGDNKGKTTVHLEGDSLLLSPDPVIRLHGREPVETRYVKVGSP